MVSIIEEEIMDNHNKADSFISLFFLGLDVLFYLVLFSLYHCKLKDFGSPKQKLFLFVILDGLLRLINIYADSYRKTVIQELTFSLIATIQFSFSMSILEQIFTGGENDSFMRNELQIRNKSLFSFLFFCLVFSLKGIITSYGLLSTIQCVVTLIALSIFYKYMNNKIELFLSNIQQKYNQFTGKTFISNIPFFIYIYFSINYILQLFTLMIDNPLYESYMNMVYTIFKEVGKYLVLLFLTVIYNTYKKYVLHSSTGYEANQNVQNEKQKVHVYKDEEETDKF